ncbi:metallophosphoesterase [Maribacter sp.]|nr:metallophosphoesterase [Maribacter sp.]
MSKKIAYVTDIHLDEQFPIDQHVDARKNWEIILNDISSRNIHEIIFGGDIGEKSANKWFFDSLDKFTLGISLGNHDDFSEVMRQRNFRIPQGQTELYYTQELPFYKFIFLDSSSGSISDPQFDWFKKELLTTKNIMLFIHHPILALDAEVDKRFALKGRDKIKTELLDLKNDVSIFCGHYHLEDKKKNGTVRQYITPASSYQVEKIPDEIKVNNESFGYRIIELDKEELRTELVLFT